MRCHSVFALLACLIVPVVAQAQQGKAPTRPNILFCIADDWSWPHAGAYGDKVVKTPNFDKLVAEGMRFDRAYCVSPSCTPSRGAILTGQWIHRLEDGGNLWSMLAKQYVTYPDLLEAAGYAVGLTGKGWGPGNFKEAGRDRNPAGPTGKNFPEFLAGVPADKPFCFWYGSTDPHRPYEPGIGVKAGLKLEDVQVPPIFPDNATVRGDILDYYARVQRFDAQLGTMLKALEESGRAANTLVIVTSDNGMPFPRCKANLHDSGTHMPFAVRWPGKVKAGRTSTAFVSLSDVAPTVLEAAGVKVPAEMTAKSLLPVLTTEDKPVGREHVFVERERHANVRKGNLSYPARAVRTETHLYIRNLRDDRWPAGDPELFFAVGPFGDIDGGPTKDVILAMPESKFFGYACAKRPAEELYDCQADPWQLTNLADKPEHAAVKAKLRATLDQWMTATADPRAGKDGGDDRWDKFRYFGGAAKK